MSTDYTTPWEELEAAGLDDCGQPLEGHPPLPPVKPWRGWVSERRDGTAKQQLGGRRTAAVQPTLYRSRRGRGTFERRPPMDEAELEVIRAAIR